MITVNYMYTTNSTTSEKVNRIYLEYSVSTSIHLIGPLQVPKCDNNLKQVLALIETYKFKQKHV